MVETALLVDTARARPDKSVADRNSARPPEHSDFERVREDLSKPDKSREPEQDKNQKVASGERTETRPAKLAKKAEEPESADQLVPVEEPEQSEVMAAFLSPESTQVSRGNALPASTGEAGTTSASIRDIFLQMAQGGAAAKSGEATAGSAAGGLAGADSQGFKATLTEALDSKSGLGEASGTSLMTSARGVEIREGSALIRQYSTTVETPVQQGDWGDKMAGKMSWLANQRISFAEIHLNPQDMGPVDVRVSVQNDQATVTVHAQNPTVRELLELNSHRLRDMMQENGMNLAQMDVSDQPAREQNTSGEGEGGGGDEQHPGRDGDSGMVSLDGEAVRTGEIHMQWQSQVDTYA